MPPSVSVRTWRTSAAGSIGSWPSWMRSLVGVVGIARIRLGVGLPAADGREEGYFVAGLERGRPGGKLAIAGDGDRAAMFGQFRIASDALGKKVFNARFGRNFDGLLTVTNGVLQSSKKEHVEADRIGVSGRHMGIVAPRRDCGQQSGFRAFEHGGA